ncbi:Coiled-coil domain-containing protein 57 [Phytophthora citrophthora]|uniref:Coiled-coil domain-containing protein 57 n=1 Tax=Phytophthora citrophthora TaxID=4793 RepID=A0AAD9GA02_9STRA|nr:Coiled-coil domain-containing protein 57 [Phytophthora citrophthora]
MEPDPSPPSLAARVSPGNIRSLILEKEKELHDINEYRIRTLEALLRDKETAATGAKQKLSKLQEDFKYNLKLLEGRDEELALYDANFASLKNVLRDREAELSEIRAREAELQVEIQRFKQRAEEQEVHYQQKLKDGRAQMEGARWKFEDELRQQQDAMETQRRSMERQMREKEEDVENQRRELTVTFDEVMRKRETEFKRTTDELQTKVRDLELNMKALTRDADAQKERAGALKAKNENLQQMLQENDKEMKALEWTMADVKAAKDAKVGELETEVAKLNEVKQKLLDEYESKMAELLQSLHSVEKAFVQQKTQCDDDLQHLVERKKSEMQEMSARSEAKLEVLATRLRESEERVEAVQAELKQVKWDADDKLMDKEREVERVKSAFQDLEDEQQRAANDVHKQLRAGDREVQILQERLQDSTRQISLLKEKEKIQRQEFLESIEKQEDLQRELVAVNLRWENRWQDQQQEIEERHELRVRELQQVKERLIAEKEEVEERLLGAENEVQRLRSELSSLKSSARITESFGSHYLASAARRSGDVRASAESVHVAPSPLWSDDPGTLSPMAGVSPLVTESPQLRANTGSVNALEVENAKLRDLIRQMKESLAQQAEEMETTAGQASSSRSASKLAAQLLEAQERCVNLERQLQSSGKDVVLQLETCQRELTEAKCMIEVKTKQVADLEARVQEFEGAKSGPELQSGRHAIEAQLADLKRRLEAANADIDRLVRERSQLMELSNQLRADLRRSGSEEGGSRTSPPRVEFAGKKDYENMIAELTRSLEEARVHNKTLKKELRRMVKVHVQQQQDREAEDRHTESSASNGEGDHTQSESRRRRSSTLSIMKSLDPGSNRGSTRSNTSTSRRSTSEATTKSDLDEQLLALAQKKRPSARKSRSSTQMPPTIEENATDSDVEADVSAAEARSEDDERSARSGGKSALSKLFQSQEADRRDSADSNATIGGSSSAKVTDARLKLQQAKEMLMLSGKRAPVTGPRASLSTFAAEATRTSSAASDRETTSQRSAVKKMKQLQTKRAEMVNERKKVRNYNLTS